MIVSARGIRPFHSTPETGMRRRLAPFNSGSIPGAAMLRFPPSAGPARSVSCLCAPPAVSHGTMPRMRERSEHTVPERAAYPPRSALIPSGVRRTLSRASTTAGSKPGSFRSLSMASSRRSPSRWERGLIMAQRYSPHPAHAKPEGCSLPRVHADIPSRPVFHTCRTRPRPRAGRSRYPSADHGHIPERA